MHTVPRGSRTGILIVSHVSDIIVSVQEDGSAANVNVISPPDVIHGLLAHISHLANQNAELSGARKISISLKSICGSTPTFERLFTRHTTGGGIGVADRSQIDLFMVSVPVLAGGCLVYWLRPRNFHGRDLGPMTYVNSYQKRR